MNGVYIPISEFARLVGVSTQAVRTKKGMDEYLRDTKPKTVKLLDVSLDYWRKRGIEDWGIVVDKEVPDHEEK